MSSTLKYQWKLNEIPLFLVYLLLPVISSIAAFVGIGRINYEIVWICVLPFLILSIHSHTLSHWCSKSILIIFLLVFLKYILPIAFYKEVVWRAWMMDLKWIYYLLISIIWIDQIGIFTPSVLYKYGRNFAIFYICYVIFRNILAGGFQRESGNLLDESNYDCFLLLIPFCFIQQCSKSKYDYYIFFLATVLSTSKTGIFSFLSLLVLSFLRRSKYKLPILIIFIFLVIVWIYIYFISRGIDDIESIDRAIFFIQFLEYLEHTSWSNILFGIFPGTSMVIDTIPQFEWYIYNFETLNNIKGCYPFYFHSTYMRIAIVWGIPIMIGCVIYCIMVLKRCKYPPLKNLIVLFLLESLSLSALSLVNVSIIFFITIFSAYLINKRLGNSRKNLYNVILSKSGLQNKHLGHNIWRSSINCNRLSLN